MSAGGSFEQNTADAARHLTPFASGTLGHLIDGAKVASVSGATFTNTSPIDHSELGQVAAGDHADIDAAARAADAAFAAWHATPGATRRRVLHDLADLIEERAQQIALVESADTGQAIRFMSSAALRGAENFRYFADMAPSVGNGQSLPTEEFVNYTLRRAIGPVGVITPWNTPFMLSTWKIAPALAAGCTVVHKPAEWSPLTASLLGDFALEAGLPAGALNVVHGMGHTAGRSLTEHPLIRAVAFVGESVTGSAIQAQSAATLKRLHFELGGKNPVIVFDDADLDRALDAVVFMIFSLNGERCTSSSRLLVQESVRDEFEQRLTERVHALRVGHPLDPATEIGPLIHSVHRDKVRSYEQTAIDGGATVVVGGGAPTDPSSNYVNPMLFLKAHNDMRIAREEIFGPVLTSIAFTNEDDAVRKANDTDYGLAAYVWTGDTGRAHRMGRDLDVGMVWVNSHNVRHLPTPFGGTKRSGIGRDGGDHSFEFYTETKNVAIAYGDHAIPKLGAVRPITPHLAAHRAGTGTRLGPAPADAAAVVVAVHGRALSAAFMIENLVDRLGNERADEIAWILPEADGASWYPLGFLAPLADNQPALDDALSVMAAIEDELADVDPARVVWLGYSQGACVVAEHVARHPRRWGAIAVLTGGMIGPAVIELTIDGSFQGTPTYFSNGDADEWVPLWRTEATAEQFRAAGADVTLEVFAGRTHEIGDAEVARVRALIDAVMS